MKKIFIASLILLCAEVASCQSIVFNKTSYNIGEVVTASVTGDLIGIENDIKKSSYSAIAGTIELGSATTTGFYRVDFLFTNNVTKSYLIAILSSSQNTTDEYVIALPNVTLKIESNIVRNIFRYFQNEKEKLLEVTKKATKKFGTENAVGVVLNASFCITTISGRPSIFAICKSLSASNLKKLGLVMMQAYLEDMRAKNYITEKEYNAVYGVLTVSQIGAIVKSNCSMIFKSLKVLADDQNLKIAIGYFEQQCKTTVVIIDKVTLL